MFGQQELPFTEMKKSVGRTMIIKRARVLLGYVQFETYIEQISRRLEETSILEINFWRYAIDGS